MNIRTIICDVDGTLTDGRIYLDAENLDIKAFYARDGQVLKFLPRIGLNTLFMTGRKSEVARRRAAELGCDILDNISDKKTALKKYLAEKGLTAEETAYLGDDINDYAAMRLCRFKACPSDAVKEVKAICDYVAENQGGHGAVREICEHLLQECGLWNDFLRVFDIYEGDDQ